MTFLFLVLAIGVITITALLLTGRFIPNLGQVYPADHAPDLGPDGDFGDSRFEVVIRGYRMGEVDHRIIALETEISQLKEQLKADTGG